jgi:hypothetical protein
MRTLTMVVSQLSTQKNEHDNLALFTAARARSESFALGQHADRLPELGRAVRDHLYVSKHTIFSSSTMKGGPRKGAGRPRGADKRTVTIKLAVEVIDLLHELPKGSMSAFVERALLREFKRTIK